MHILLLTVGGRGVAWGLYIYRGELYIAPRRADKDDRGDATSPIIGKHMSGEAPSMIYLLS